MPKTSMLKAKRVQFKKQKMAKLLPNGPQVYTKFLQVDTCPLPFGTVIKFFLPISERYDTDIVDIYQISIRFDTVNV